MHGAYERVAAPRVLCRSSNRGTPRLLEVSLHFSQRSLVSVLPPPASTYSLLIGQVSVPFRSFLSLSRRYEDEAVNAASKEKPVAGKVQSVREQLLRATCGKFGDRVDAYDPVEKKATRLLEWPLTPATIKALHECQAHDLIADKSSNFAKLCHSRAPRLEERKMSASACSAKREWKLALEVSVRDDPLLQEYVMHPDPDHFVTLPHIASKRAQLFHELAVEYEHVGQLEESSLCYDVAGDDWSLLGMAMSLGVDDTQSRGFELASEMLLGVERDSKNTKSLFKHILRDIMTKPGSEQNGGTTGGNTSDTTVGSLMSTRSHLPPASRRSSLMSQEGHVSNVWDCLKTGGNASSNSNTWGTHLAMQPQKRAPPAGGLSRGGRVGQQKLLAAPSDFAPNDWFGHALRYMHLGHSHNHDGDDENAHEFFRSLGPFGDDEDGNVGYWRFEDGLEGLSELEAPAGEGDDGVADVYTFDKTAELNHAIVEGRIGDSTGSSSVRFEVLDSESDQCPFDPGDGRKVKPAHAMIIDQWWLMGTDYNVESTGLKVPIAHGSSLDVGFHMLDSTRTDFAVEMWTFIPANFTKDAGGASVVLACRKEKWEGGDASSATPLHSSWSLQMNCEGRLEFVVYSCSEDGTKKNVVSECSLCNDMHVHVGAWNHIALSAECGVGSRTRGNRVTTAPGNASIFLNGKLHQEIRFVQPFFRPAVEAWLYFGFAPVRTGNDVKESLPLGKSQVESGGERNPKIAEGVKHPTHPPTHPLTHPHPHTHNPVFHQKASFEQLECLPDVFVSLFRFSCLVRSEILGTYPLRRANFGFQRRVFEDC